MGQKVNPIGMRIAVNRGWDSKWFAEGKEYVKWLHEDIIIRDLLFSELKKAAVAKIEIDRIKDSIKLVIRTARPGMVLGDAGKNLNIIIKKIRIAIKNRHAKVTINVVEVRRPELNAKLVAENIANQLVNRASFRIVQKFAIKKAKFAGAKGIKTSVSGRLNGVEMARTEGYLDGNVPLATLRSDVDYATAEALTTYGQIGVKVWIYKGVILSGQVREEEPELKNFRNNRSRKPYNNFRNNGKFDSNSKTKNYKESDKNIKPSNVKKEVSEHVNA